MKVPFSWLKEFVDIDVTAQELEEKLFSCGFEVEELIPLDAGISKVVVGKIVEMEKQEGTHLTKCVVDCGAYGHEIRISTGAANMKLGDCVPTALDGSTLPGGITIKARKMQGVESNGMLCSGAELGLNDDLFPGSEVYGLLILPEDSVPGTDIAPVVGLDDYIFDISITANRPDCQSVLGIAREVAAVLGKPLHMPAMDYKAVCEPDAPITVKVEAPELCPRYMAHYVRTIRMGESPPWPNSHRPLTKWSMFHCPLDQKTQIIKISDGTLRPRLSYALPLALVRHKNLYGLKTSNPDLRNSSRIINLTEPNETQHNYSGTFLGSNGGGQMVYLLYQASETALSQRHKLRAGTLFLDGHVELVPFSRYYASGINFTSLTKLELK